jgi:flavin-dependent dehydrogenase
MTYDALILGGGPAGATAGLVLARAGWSVAVVEKASFPRRKVCGEFISASTLSLLRDLGVDESFQARAGPDVRRVGLFARDVVLTAAMPQPQGVSPPWGRALDRRHLDLLLLDAAARAGAQLWQPFTALDLTRTASGYACTIATQDVRRTLEAQVVIAAYGSWQRGVLPEPRPSPHRPSDLLAFKAHFWNSALAGDLMPLLMFPGGYGGMVHTDGGRVTLSCCIRRDALTQIRQRSPRAHAGAAVLDHIKLSCLGVRDALARARLDDAWLSAGPIRPGIRRHHADGVFFAGNIAGEAHPVIAEGISMAMQSAWLLAGLLIAERREIVKPEVRARIGRNYRAAWKAAFAPRLHAAAVLAQIAMRPQLVTVSMPLLKRWPAILKLGAQLSGKGKLVAAHDIQARNNSVAAP